ncbi:MAG: glutamate-5-semialdehyde dehydrogenase [Anaerolineales bacterium]
MLMVHEMGRKARAAFRQMARAQTETKNATLRTLADVVLADCATILAANAEDVAAGKVKSLTEALIDRLLLTEERLAVIADDLRALAELPDPIGETFDASMLPNGLRIHRQRVPLGVLGVIYEARPNVTLDVAGLAIKTGNAAILRGGSETLHSNRALMATVKRALAQHGLPPDAVQFIDSTDRALVLELLQLADGVDVIIPRGGAGLHQFCRENSRVPVITGGIGICHLYVDESADVERALDVIHNAKTQRPSVCNSLDTVLVHRALASEFLPAVVDYLRPAGVTFRAEPRALHYLQSPISNSPIPHIQPAGPDDFDTEWMSLVLGLKVVASLDEAMEHIAAHSTAHSDGILTRDEANARRFVAEVDSAAVFVNASTRFNDGSQFGLGAEAAVSTQRLHVRGPMGLRELTTYKWVVAGEYHIRP